MSRARNRRGDNPSLLARAETQTAAGADALFNRLDRLDALGSQREQAAALFARWAERLGSGAWNPEIAELSSTPRRLSARSRTTKASADRRLPQSVATSLSPHILFRPSCRDLLRRLTSGIRASILYCNAGCPNSLCLP